MNVLQMRKYIIDELKPVYKILNYSNDFYKEIYAWRSCVIIHYVLCGATHSGPHIQFHRSFHQNDTYFNLPMDNEVTNWNWHTHWLFNSSPIDDVTMWFQSLWVKFRNQCKSANLRKKFLQNTIVMVHLLWNRLGAT